MDDYLKCFNKINFFWQEYFLNGLASITSIRVNKKKMSQAIDNDT